MIDLKKVSKGKISRPPRWLIYGADGIGKTTFAAGSPDPFFIDINKGSGGYDVRRVVPETWSEVLDWVNAVEQGKIECKTLVIDSLTDLEVMGHAEFFPGSTIDKFEGGYGKGDTQALMKWRELLTMLERVWNKGVGIGLIAHMRVQRFEDPTGPGFDRFVLGCREKLAGLLRQWSDYVLFAREDVFVQGAKGEKGKAGTTNTRWIYTRRVPAFDAKARGTVLFPEKLLLSWRDFQGAIESDAKMVVDVKREIDAMLEEIADPDLSSQVKAWVEANPLGLVDARNRVSAILEEKKVKNG